jgi:hypothetical protein
MTAGSVDALAADGGMVTRPTADRVAEVGTLGPR